MTVKEYITGKFQQFGIKLSDADLADVEIHVNPDEAYTQSNQKDAYLAIALHIVPFYLLRAKSIEENGFSISWDNDALLKWYSWLCNYLDIDDSLNGKSVITDMTNLW
jgi:hypothetical protein